MVRSCKQLKGRALRARDGVIGEVVDFYFDDHDWYLRYFVIETGSWLEQRRVLIAPEALGPLDWGLHVFPVNLSMQQVRNCPGIESHRPVSRQDEAILRKYYGWPPYWDPVFGTSGFPAPLLAPIPAGNSSEPGLTDGNAPISRRGDPHLRSVKDTIGHHIEALDGSVGHVDDFLVDEKAWRIRYLVIDTRNWWPGKKVLLAPGWITDVSWANRRVTVDLTRDVIKGSPPYDTSTSWNPAYATELHDYYGRPRYSDWDEDIVAGAPPLRRKR
jgi:hypothetical protein